MLKKVLIVVGLCLPLICFAKSSVIMGKVARVYSGDIMAVATAQGKLYVRLAGIDTPDMKQSFGKQAQQLLEKAVLDKMVLVRTVGRDPCGRQIALVWLQNNRKQDLSSKMVADGAAWVYRRYTESPYLLKLEQQARENAIGLWALPVNKRQPPWEWRKSARFRGIAPSDSCHKAIKQSV